MNEPSSSHDPALLAAVAEASAWIALLHGPRRTPAAERGFQHWLAESDLHRQAFEHATDTWNQNRAAVRRSARVEVTVPGEVAKKPRARKVRHVVWAAAATLLLGMAGALYYFYVLSTGITTGLGERRTLVLEDGTQVTLNTATRLVVDFNERVRRVRLESGEALFEVSKHAGWPFVVAVADREVTALGTAFLVRRDEEHVTITLVEGKVAVASAQEPPAKEGKTLERGTVLAPGERLTFRRAAAPAKVDRPELEKLTAWQQGLVNIDDLSLAEAIAEMNRYNGLKLAVEGPAADIRVSGVFRVTDSANLAKAVALTHGLKIRTEDRRLVLFGEPHAPSDAHFRANLSGAGEQPQP